MKHFDLTASHYLHTPKSIITEERMTVAGETTSLVWDGSIVCGTLDFGYII